MFFKNRNHLRSAPLATMTCMLIHSPPLQKRCLWHHQAYTYGMIQNSVDIPFQLIAYESEMA